MEPRKHPEGLPFEPEGPGFTGGDPIVDLYHRSSLLTEHNIAAVKHNHPEQWLQAFHALPGQTRDRRTGRLEGLTEDERRRLATLSTLVEHQMFVEDRLIVVGERQGGTDVPAGGGNTSRPSDTLEPEEDDRDGLN